MKTKKWKATFHRTENISFRKHKGYGYWRGQVVFVTSTYKTREEAIQALNELKLKFNLNTPPPPQA